MGETTILPDGHLPHGPLCHITSRSNHNAAYAATHVCAVQLGCRLEHSPLGAGSAQIRLGHTVPTPDRAGVRLVVPRQHASWLGPPPASATWTNIVQTQHHSRCLTTDPPDHPTGSVLRFRRGMQLEDSMSEPGLNQAYRAESLALRCCTSAADWVTQFDLVVSHSKLPARFPVISISLDKI